AVMLGRIPYAAASHPKTSGLNFARAVYRPRVLVVAGLGLCEGAAIFGALPYLAAVMQLQTMGGGVGGGGALAPYGLATLVAASRVRVLSARFELSFLIFIGAGLAALGYGAASVRPDLLGVVFASTLAGAGFAFLHSSLMTWAIDVAPELRATQVS